MAITIQTAPAFQGFSQNPLLWILTTDTAPAPRLYMQVVIETEPYSDDWLFVGTFHEDIDADGLAKFDLSRILGDWLEHDPPGFPDIAPSVASNVNRRYKLRHAEGIYGARTQLGTLYQATGSADYIDLDFDFTAGTSYILIAESIDTAQLDSLVKLDSTTPVDLQGWVLEGQRSVLYFNPVSTYANKDLELPSGVAITIYESNAPWSNYTDPQAVLKGGFESSQIALPPAPPDAPTGMTATKDSFIKVDLALVDQSGGTAEHRIWVSQLGPDTGYTLLDTWSAGQKSGSHTNVVPGTQYWYRAEAVVGGSGSQEFSNVATATVDVIPVPVAPTAIEFDADTIRLSWTNAIAAASGRETEIEVATDGIGGTYNLLATTIVPTAQYDHDGVPASSMRWYRMRHKVGSHYSDYSEVATGIIILPIIDYQSAHIDKARIDNQGTSGIDGVLYSGKEIIFNGTNASGTITTAGNLSWIEFWINPDTVNEAICDFGVGKFIELVAGVITLTGLGTATIEVDDVVSTIGYAGKRQKWRITLDAPVAITETTIGENNGTFGGFRLCQLTSNLYTYLINEKSTNLIYDSITNAGVARPAVSIPNITRAAGLSGFNYDIKWSEGIKNDPAIYSVFEGTDKSVRFSTSLATYTNVAVEFNILTTDQQFTLFIVGQSLQYFICEDDANNPWHWLSITNIIVDGNTVNGSTRQQLRDLVADGNKHSVRLEGMNWSGHTYFDIGRLNYNEAFDFTGLVWDLKIDKDNSGSWDHAYTGLGLNAWQDTIGSLNGAEETTQHRQAFPEKGVPQSANQDGNEYLVANGGADGLEVFNTEIELAEGDFYESVVLFDGNAQYVGGRGTLTDFLYIYPNGENIVFRPRAGSIFNHTLISPLSIGEVVVYKVTRTSLGYDIFVNAELWSIDSPSARVATRFKQILQGSTGVCLSYNFNNVLSGSNLDRFSEAYNITNLAATKTIPASPTTPTEDIFGELLRNPQPTIKLDGESHGRSQSVTLDWNTAFTLETEVYFNDSGGVKIIASNKDMATLAGWDFYKRSDDTIAVQANRDGSNYALIHTNAAISIGATVALTITFDGSENVSGIAIAFDAVDQAVTDASVGSIATGQILSTERLQLGRLADNTLHHSGSQDNFTLELIA